MINYIFGFACGAISMGVACLVMYLLSRKLDKSKKKKSKRKSGVK